MKKILNWLKSPESDFYLFILLIILANTASRNAFLRFDLTSQKSYSLSAASKTTVKTLTQPLSVKLFFSDNLPSPYNSVSQYIKDILIEYKGAANKNFSYSFFDMNKPENQRIAGGYGIHQAQIQEIKNNEVGFKNVYLGLAVSYGDSIEVMDSITSSDGFEYQFTTKIAKMISAADTLAGLSAQDKIELTLYASEKLKEFGIGGFDELDNTVQEAFNKINKRNLNRLTLIRHSSGDEDILSTKYGLQSFKWQNKDGTQGNGIFGLVIGHGENFRTVPLSIQRSIFGYVVSGLDSLEENINGSLQSLLSKAVDIGYITGHQEAALSSEKDGNSKFSNLISDMYNFKEIDLNKEDIPLNLTMLVINGPKEAFSEDELYKLDQFIMRGGNLMVFEDPFNVVQGSYYQSSEYTLINTGLNKLWDSYGIKFGKNYVMDENCYIARQQGFGNVPLYWAPQLQKKQLASHPVSKNLGYVIFLQADSIDISEAKNAGIKTTVLAKSSEKSWIESKNIRLTPDMSAPYDKSSEKSENLAVLLEGKFKSAYSEPPSKENNGEKDELSADLHISEGIQNAKIFAAGTSFITSDQLIDENGSEPVAIFIRNAIDYLNGNTDLCTMRTKGLSLNTLSNTKSTFAAIVKYFNQFGIAILTAAAGLIVWHSRNLRRKRIRSIYNPDDKREIK